MQAERDDIPVGLRVDFDIYAPPADAGDFHSAWHRLQAPGTPPVVWTPHNGGHWIPTRAAVIGEVMSDFERFSNRTIMIPKIHGEAHGLIPTTLDPPEHRPYRELLNSGLAPARIQRLEGEIRATARELITPLAVRGECDFITEYAELFPIRVFMALMDLPMSDAAQTKYWCDQLLRPDGSMTFAEAMEKLFAYMEPVVKARREAPGEDLVSDLVAGQVGDRDITHEEAMKLAVQVLIAGLDTVVNFLGFALCHLAQHPEEQQQLRAQPELLPAATDELLRRFPVVTVGREVTEDFEFHGAPLRKGDMIAAPTPLAGTDEEAVDDPFRVDFGRRAVRHLTFGRGHHLCPGRNLARTEIRITLEEWLAAIPEFRIPDEEPVAFHGGIVGVLEKLPLRWQGAKP